MREVEEVQEEQSEYTRRYSSTTSPTVGHHACYNIHCYIHSLIFEKQQPNFDLPQGPRRGATPEEDLRRMHVREEEVYRGGRYQYILGPSRQPFNIILSDLVTVGHHRQSLLTIGVRR